MIKSGFVDACLLCVMVPVNPQVAVEVISRKHHCMANNVGALIGPMQWRHRQLAAHGCTVVVVWEDCWQLAEGREDTLQQVAYLRGCLSGAGVQLPLALDGAQGMVA